MLEQLHNTGKSTTLLIFLVEVQYECTTKGNGVPFVQETTDYISLTNLHQLCHTNSSENPPSRFYFAFTLLLLSPMTTTVWDDPHFAEMI